MAKKEIRVNFNLDNENEKELYEFLLSRTSASGYLKDLALDVLQGGKCGRYNSSTEDTALSDIAAALTKINSTKDTALSDIAAALTKINSTLSNIKVIATEEENHIEDERTIDSANVKELVIEADDLDF